MFLHRLALHLGMTVSELLERATAREIHEWVVFDHHWGLPDVVNDLQNALLCTVAVNIMRSPEAGPAQIDDFKILKERGPEQQDFVESEAAKFKKVFGG
jgi:hypothetical protein